MMFSIESPSGTPIYMQIMDQVRQYVVSGRLKAGDPLPPVRSVDGVNHMTVSKAYQRLQLEGIAERIRGKGMFVSKTSVNPLAAIKPQVVALVGTVLRLGLSCEHIDAAVDQAWSDLQKSDAVADAVADAAADAEAASSMDSGRDVAS